MIDFQELNLNNLKLIYLFEIKNSEYGTIKVCKTEDFSKNIYVLDGKIIEDSTMIRKIEEEAGLKFPEKLKGIII